MAFIPREFLLPYLLVNGFAALCLWLAFIRPRLVVAIGVLVFGWAAWINTTTAFETPGVYLDYAELAILGWYRDFILGWFSRHVTLMVVGIAAGQAVIAVLLVAQSTRALGTAGAVVFLAAIIPLGIGAGLPFSLTFGAALVVAWRRTITTSSVVAPRRGQNPQFLQL